MNWVNLNGYEGGEINIFKDPEFLGAVNCNAAVATVVGRALRGTCTTILFQINQIFLIFLFQIQSSKPPGMVKSHLNLAGLL